jgi:hypothetical protein
MAHWIASREQVKAPVQTIPQVERKLDVTPDGLPSQLRGSQKNLRFAAWEEIPEVPSIKPDWISEKEFQNVRTNLELLREAKKRRDKGNASAWPHGHGTKSARDAPLEGAGTYSVNANRQQESIACNHRFNNEMNHTVAPRPPSIRPGLAFNESAGHGSTEMKALSDPSISYLNEKSDYQPTPGMDTYPDPEIAACEQKIFKPQMDRPFNMQFVMCTNCGLLGHGWRRCQMYEGSEPTKEQCSRCKGYHKAKCKFRKIRGGDI